MLSSEARDVLGCRSPADVLNLLNVWGLSRDRGVEAMGVNPRGVVVNEGLKRSAFRGVIDVIDGGEREVCYSLWSFNVWTLLGFGISISN